MQRTLSLSDREETLKFISGKDIRILNLCHVPDDGRLRTLSFSTASKNRVGEILDYGERVDGSSLFRSIPPGKSDIYLQPDVQRAFVNPFAVLPTLNIMCNYMDGNGKTLDIAPSNVLRKAEESLHSSKGMILKALAELEFYIMTPLRTQPLFRAEPDSNYHASSPFTQYEEVRNEILAVLDMIGIQTKYGHGEVGCIVDKNGMFMEQHEIELIPKTLSQTAEAIPLVKWTIRNVCSRHGVSASFVPKMDLAHAGTGMHIHLCATRRGKNVMSDPDGGISKETLAMIGGILKLAPSLSAFGNPTPVSYLRFIARKESPMNICWSASNRLALIRIPLWWNFMKASKAENCRETFEYRAPDAFANAHMLLAGLAIAVDYGTSNQKEAIKISEDLHIDDRKDNSQKLRNLPRSCSESAANLRRQRRFYEANSIFPRKLVDSILSKLEAFGDKNLWKTLSSKPEMVETLVTQYIHYG